MRHRKLYLSVIGILVSVLLIVSGGREIAAFELNQPQTPFAFGKGILKLGARGGDVYELQGRLKLLGFYTGPIDGVFTTRTYNAVRLFQYRFGLKTDGTVGPKTKLKLWQATKHWRPELTPRGSSLTLKPGSTGIRVRDLQAKLRLLGYYTGPIDGVYGDRVTKAIRLFQYRFGLKIDGVAGDQTLAKIRAASSKAKATAPSKKPPAPARPAVVKTSYGMSRNDIKLLAQTVYAEARGEPYVGQVAIAAVILNRLESDKFPNTLSGIIFQPLAFEAVADGQIWLEPDETAKKAAIDALNGWDPSGGALYYFNPARATSKWIWSRPQIKRIGKHIFCR